MQKQRSYKVMILLPIFSKLYSAPAVRWRAFVNSLQRYEIFKKLIIVEFPNKVTPWSYKLMKRSYGNIVLYSLLSIKKYNHFHKHLLIGKTGKTNLNGHEFLYTIIYKDLVNTLYKIADTEQPSLIIASVPPPHTAILAYILSRAYKVPYIVDVRDLIEYFYFYENIRDRNFIRSILWKSIIHPLYKKSLKNANGVTTVTPIFKKCLELNYNKEIYLIPNGILKRILQAPPMERRSKQIVIVEAAEKGLGLTLGIDKIINVWRNIIKEKFPEYKLIVIGGICNAIKKYYDEKDLENIDLLGLLPYEKVIDILSRSKGSIIWCLNTRNPALTGSVPVKFYDSIGAGTPVFAIGPKTYLSILINKLKLGIYIEEKCNTKSLIKGLINFITLIENNAFDVTHIINNQDKFLRSNYVDILKELILKVVEQREH